MNKKIIYSFKGFDKDLKCRGFQYEIGKEYEEPKAIACNAGFHACEIPLDVFSHYPPAKNRFKRDGYAFLGWKAVSTLTGGEIAEGAAVAAGDTISFTA